MNFVARTTLAVVMGISFIACGDDGGGSETSTSSPGTSATTTTSGAVTPSTEAGGTTAGVRGFCDVNADLDELSEELFLFEASPERTEDLVSQARALADEAVAVAPPEIAEQVATVAAGFVDLLDIITDADYDISTLDASVFADVYGDEDIQTAGGIVDEWIAANC